MKIQVVAIVVAAILSAASLTMSLRSSDRDRECDFGRWTYENLAELQQTSHDYIRWLNELDQEARKDVKAEDDVLLSLKLGIVEAKFALEILQVSMREAEIDKLESYADLALDHFENLDPPAIGIDLGRFGPIVHYAYRFFMFSAPAIVFWEILRKDVAQALDKTADRIRERCLWHLPLVIHHGVCAPPRPSTAYPTTIRAMIPSAVTHSAARIAALTPALPALSS